MLTHLRGDDDLQRVRIRRAAEGVVGIEDLIELEPMRDQLGSDRSCSTAPFSAASASSTVSTSRVVMVMFCDPQPLQMQIDLDAMHADIGDDAAGRDDILAGDEGRRHADRLDRRIDADGRRSAS